MLVTRCTAWLQQGSPQTCWEPWAPPAPPHPPAVLPRLHGSAGAGSLGLLAGPGSAFRLLHTVRYAVSPSTPQALLPTPQTSAASNDQDQAAEPLLVCREQAALKAPAPRDGRTDGLSRTAPARTASQDTPCWVARPFAASHQGLPLPSTWSSGHCHTQRHGEYAPYRPPPMRKGSQEDSGQSPGVCTAWGTP